jgi:PhnB protein
VVDDADTVVRRAVTAGATEMSPVSEEHGWRLGRMLEPFGHEWEIGAPLA